MGQPGGGGGPRGANLRAALKAIAASVSGSSGIGISGVQTEIDEAIERGVSYLEQAGWPMAEPQAMGIFQDLADAAVDETVRSGKSAMDIATIAALKGRGPLCPNIFCP